MPAGLMIQDGSNGSNQLLSIDENGNAFVNTPTTANEAGYIGLGTVVSDGIASPSLAPRQVRSLQSTDGGALRSAVPSMLGEAIFPGAAIDTGFWKQTTTTMTIAVSGGWCILNSGNSVATTTDAFINSYRAYPIRQDSETLVSFVIQIPVVPQANTTMEWGLFYPVAHAAPLDGVLFRINGAGNVIAVASFGGTENIVDLGFTLLASDTYEFSMRIVADTVYYYGSANATSVLPLLATLEIPTAGSSTTSSFYAPLAAQIYNGGSAPGLANQLKISQCRAVMVGDWPQRDYRFSLVGNGCQGTQGQVGATLGSLANYANSAVPASATLSNTTAGYATLGGQWQFAAVVGAETDYALFAYLIPAGTAAIPGKSFFVTGVRIDSVNTGAAVATTATLLQWSLATGSTAVSLATADGAGTKARRVFPLGLQTWPIAAAIGAGPQEPPIVHDFQTALTANQGEYIHIIVKSILGTATGSQIIRGVVAIEGIWE